MKIGLLQVDDIKKFPNLPLMKLSAHHKALGHDVEQFMPFQQYDIVYKQKIFSKEFFEDYPYWIQADKVIQGGSGYDYENKLPDKIEHIYPDYSLYPELTKEIAYGFLTRGCPRGCAFCIVQKKEGNQSLQVADLDEFWRGQNTIKLLDPNITACKDKEHLFKELVKSKKWVDFTQGVDIRLTTEDDARLIDKMRIKMIHFAWDFPKENLKPYFLRFNKYCKLDSRKKRVYVLTNFGSSHEEDLYRIYWLRENGYDPYLAIFEKWKAPKKTRHLQRYVNNKFIFHSNQTRDFGDYLKSVGW